MVSKLMVSNNTALAMPLRFKAQASRCLRAVTQVTKASWGEVGVTLVEPQISRQLNRSYRQHDWVTDVLSFTYEVKPLVSGELIICLVQAQTQAKRHGWSLTKELQLLLIHGFLHLLGYDHIKAADRMVMRQLEQLVVAKS